MGYEYKVRRLTEKECERLQGFPDDWSRYGIKDNGEEYELPSSQRYKLQGNSIGTYCWIHILGGMYERLTGEQKKLVSLFDGQGGFPLIWRNIADDTTTLWASEVEPHAIAVTRKQFPEMKHYGDITQIHITDPQDVPDILVGGSPCQDLSVAGKRQGLAGERSGLFMEQIRVFKEARNVARSNNALGGGNPNCGSARYFLWENVPGALSSHGNDDFYAVLDEIVRIAEPHTSIPQLAEKDRWHTNGSIVGDGYSVAWRVADLQYYGRPQRRRRIQLVADFGGHSAAEILFEREGCEGNYFPGAEAWERIAGAIAPRTYESGQPDCGQPGASDDGDGA